MSSGDGMAISGQSPQFRLIKRPKGKTQWGMGPLESARDTFASDAGFCAGFTPDKSFRGCTEYTGYSCELHLSYCVFGCLFRYRNRTSTRDHLNQRSLDPRQREPRTSPGTVGIDTRICQLFPLYPTRCPQTVQSISVLLQRKRIAHHPARGSHCQTQWLCSIRVEIVLREAIMIMMMMMVVVCGARVYMCTS